MTASEKIAALEAALRSAEVRCAVLAAKLRALGEEPSEEFPMWAERLTPTEAALMGALLQAYPRRLDRWTLDAIVPKRDHAEDRDIKGIDVFVHHVRKKLGKDAIRNDWGLGYRCSPDFHQQWGQG